MSDHDYAARQAARRKEYADYMNSHAWREKRAAAIVAAGGRCQFVADRDDLCQGQGGGRCERTTGLHVHHRTYVNFRDEEIEDLRVLCAEHHGVVEILKKQCIRCGESVIDGDENEALEVWARAVDACEGMSWSDTLSSALDELDGLCPYCRHMSEKDD